MKPVHVCVATVKRYDLLGRFIKSVESSTVRPDVVWIFDNGKQPAKVAEIKGGTLLPVQCYEPSSARGVAESWNWFIANVPEERVICNDDLLFAPESIEKMVVLPGDFVSALAGSNACSCFVLRDSCVAKVGLFDESISPGYAYFEDCDYVERMVQKKVFITAVECGVVHVGGGSQTLTASSDAEVSDHHRKFLTAQRNFLAKWGRMPNLSQPGLYD